MKIADPIWLRGCPRLPVSEPKAGSFFVFRFLLTVTLRFVSVNKFANESVCHPLMKLQISARGFEWMLFCRNAYLSQPQPGFLS